MHAVAANAPNLATPFKNDNIANPTDADHARRRDSRLVEYQSPIPEEDESTETASEPAEPITPTSDTIPSSHPFHKDERLDGVFVTPKYDMKDVGSAKPPPHTSAPPPPTLPDANPAPLTKTTSTTAPNSTSITRAKSGLKLTTAQQQEQTATPVKPGIGKRVGSFVRNRLHRTPSAREAPKVPNVQNDNSQSGDSVDDQTIVETPKDLDPSTANGSKSTRRLSTFSLSARNSPKSSQGHTPPSPGSPSSTLSESRSTSEKKPSLGHKHSSSSTAISSMNQVRGIVWAGNGSKDTKHRSAFSRRRSASTDLVPRAPSDDKTIGLVDTFSKPAVEGVGMKARRLSLSLPDEFVVDSCELKKEFTDTSLLPGKRGKSCGHGATAEVKIMSRKGVPKHEEQVAVKMFRVREKNEDQDEYIKKIKSEYSIAKSLHHPNIVDTIRLCTHNNRWFHVMEFCTHGELFSLVERRLFGSPNGGSDGYYSTADRLCFFKQLLRGVDYLHSHGIAHRDIKLENLLLDKEGHLKISDFGVAEVFSGEHPGLRAAGGECGKNMGEIRMSNPGICGSLPYIAPEVLAKEAPYDPRGLDVWSCAIVYLTMTFGGCPWQAAKTEYGYYARFKKGWDDWLAEHPEGDIVDGPDGHPKCGPLFSFVNPPPLKRLLLKMLHPNPKKRILMKDVLTTTCIKNIECCCPENYEDPKCCIDATKASSRQSSKIGMTKRYLHHHVPPSPENKVAKAFQHRFDMGDGW